MRKIVLIPLVLILTFITYLFIGNLYRGFTGATMIGEKTAHFVGYYMLAAVYFALMVLMVTIILIINKILNNTYRKIINSKYYSNDLASLIFIYK